MTPEPFRTVDRGSRRNTATLVTGAGGEVGQGLIEVLADAGRRDLVALDLRKLDRDLRVRCRDTFEADICEIPPLQRIQSMYEITEIYHLAALLSTRSEYAPEAGHDVNVGGTLNLLRLAAEQATSHGKPVSFFFPSSIAVYGLPDLETKVAAGKVVEGEFNRPMTMYGCNKLYCEHLGRYYARHYRQLVAGHSHHVVEFRGLRYPGLISAVTMPSGGTSDYAAEMIHAAAEGRPYVCFVRPDTRIPFMTMPEAIDALLTLADAKRSQLKRVIYNVASFSPTALEFRDLVCEYFANAEITFEPDPQRQKIVDSWPTDIDTSAAESDWGFKPTHDLRSAFEQYLVPNITARYAAT